LMSTKHKLSRVHIQSPFLYLSLLFNSQLHRRPSLDSAQRRGRLIGKETSLVKFFFLGADALRRAPTTAHWSGRTHNATTADQKRTCCGALTMGGASCASLMAGSEQGAINHTPTRFSCSPLS